MCNKGKTGRQTDLGPPQIEVGVAQVSRGPGQIVIARVGEAHISRQINLNRKKGKKK